MIHLLTACAPGWGGRGPVGGCCLLALPGATELPHVPGQSSGALLAGFARGCVLAQLLPLLPRRRNLEERRGALELVALSLKSTGCCEEGRWSGEAGGRAEAPRNGCSTCGWQGAALRFKPHAAQVLPSRPTSCHTSSASPARPSPTTAPDLARQLSYEGAEFSLHPIPLSREFRCGSGGGTCACLLVCLSPYQSPALPPGAPCGQQARVQDAPRDC